MISERYIIFCNNGVTRLEVRHYTIMYMTFSRYHFTWKYFSSASIRRWIPDNPIFFAFFRKRKSVHCFLLVSGGEEGSHGVLRHSQDSSTYFETWYTWWRKPEYRKTTDLLYKRTNTLMYILSWCWCKAWGLNIIHAYDI